MRPVATPAPRPTQRFLAIAIIAGGLASLAVIAATRVLSPPIKYSSAPTLVSEPNPAVKPEALSDWEFMKPGPLVPGSSDGLAPETKKRMRELFVLSIRGGLQAQNTPLQIDIQGTDHDVIVFSHPSLDAAAVSELLKDFQTANTNFWNYLRFTATRSLQFKGSRYKLELGPADFESRSVNYQKYVDAYQRALEELQRGSRAEAAKPK